MPQLIPHTTGRYHFLPGIAPYSCGVVAAPGFEIVRVTLQDSLPWRQGFHRADEFLKQQGCGRADLCAMELRSPQPFTMEGFISFNGSYCAVLEEWGVFVNGVNPIARTNVCPGALKASEPVLYAFSFVRPNRELRRKTFVVAGAGELVEGTLVKSGILRRSETSPDALHEKAAYVAKVMTERLHGLGADWTDVTAVSAYTIHPLRPLLESVLFALMPVLRGRGIHWHYTRPPIIDIEFEMDLRSVVTEWVV
jgi:hypothetical protein